MPDAIGTASARETRYGQNELGLVGGRSALSAGERLYRFIFPERPGALLKFLANLPPSANISLFHYRNQGADYGRVLVGIQAEERAFQQFLQSLDYPFEDETKSPVSRLFLR